MAQRLIHLLLADMILSSRCGGYIKAPERFVFGSLLPDAYREEDSSGTERREANIYTHFRSATPDMEYRYFDFAGFYRRFEDLIKNDDLYLGYYIHLVEDAYYRYYTHVERGIPRPTSPEQVESIHADYRLLNAYIVSKYGVRGDVAVPEGFETESINGLYPFDCGKLLKDLGEDFTDRKDKETKILTEELLEGFIGKYAGRCADTLEAVKAGGKLPEPLELKWAAGKNKGYF